MDGGMAGGMSSAMAAGPFPGVWAAMSVAMMLPSAVPLLRLDFATERSACAPAILASGYLSVWIAAGVALLALDRLAAGRLLMPHGRVTTAALLGAAALYQLLPLKSACLARCRAPLARILFGWRDGLTGAARMGVENGLWCAGCCVGLMAALLAVGMMSVAWMAVFGAVILVGEDLALRPRREPPRRRRARGRSGGVGAVSFRVAGEYFESCNCDAICPCRRIGGVAGRPLDVRDLLRRPLVADRGRGTPDEVDLTGLAVALAVRTTTTRRTRRGRSCSTSTSAATTSSARRSRTCSSAGSAARTSRVCPDPQAAPGRRPPAAISLEPDGPGTGASASG